MAQRVTISISEYAWERIAGAKPVKKNMSEWMEELMLRQLDSMPPQMARVSEIAHKRNRNQNKGQGSDNALQGYPSPVKRIGLIVDKGNRLNRYAVVDAAGMVVFSVVERK